MAKTDVQHDISFDESGNVVLKKKVHVARGRQSKASGSQFELRVRHDLEARGFSVDKWTNNVDLEKDMLLPAKRKMGFLQNKLRFMTLGTGFPDFIAFSHVEGSLYRVIGVEVKQNGKLSKVEKDKCRWYLSHNIFSEILIARKEKVKNRVQIVYESFKG